MWDLLGPGIKPTSPALAGGFLTTAPPGKSCVHIFCVNICFHFFWVDIWVELLGHMVTLCLMFWVTDKLFFKVAASFYIFSCIRFQFLYILTNIYYYCLFFFLLLNHSHSGGCEVIDSSLGFCFALCIWFVWLYEVEQLFICLLDICINFLKT